MTEPNAANVVVGAGTLWVAAIGSAEPATGVLTPITTPATSVAWPSAWTQLGYTLDGSEFGWTPKLDALEVAEQLVPIKYVTSSVEAAVAFALAEITAAHIKTAFNGGTIATAAGITTFTPPVVGAEVRVMLGWDRIDGLERIIWRQCIQTGSVKQEHKRPPTMNNLPVSFNLEFPASGVAPFVHYLDSSLAS
jgi:hypothetical protein